MSWPVVRSTLLHGTTFAGGAIAAIAFMSSHSVDIYAAYDQLNTVIADISKFVSIITPIASGAYAAYKATTAQKLKDVIADPKAVEVASKVEPTPKVDAIANALKKNGG